MNTSIIALLLAMLLVSFAQVSGSHVFSVFYIIFATPATQGAPSVKKNTEVTGIGPFGDFCLSCGFRDCMLSAADAIAAEVRREKLRWLCSKEIKRQQWQTEGKAMTQNGRKIRRSLHCRNLSLLSYQRSVKAARKAT